MNKGNIVSVCLAAALLMGVSGPALAENGWNSRDVFNALDDSCRKKIKKFIANDKALRGASNHHTNAARKELMNLQKQKASAEEECEVLIGQSKKQKGKYTLRWAPNSIMAQIDWK